MTLDNAEIIRKKSNVVRGLYNILLEVEIYGGAKVKVGTSGARLDVIKGDYLHWKIKEEHTKASAELLNFDCCSANSLPAGASPRKSIYAGAVLSGG